MQIVLILCYNSNVKSLIILILPFENISFFYVKQLLFAVTVLFDNLT